MIKWNEYTWYSKLAAVIFFIGVLPVLTFYIGTQYQATIDAIQQQDSQVVQDHPGHVPMPSNTGTQSLSVTQADNNKTVTFHVGDRFLLNLGEYEWNLSLSNQSVISRVKNIAVIRGAQGIYTADQVGTTVLSATGRPYCAQGAMCSMLEIAFHVTIKVVK